MELIGARRVHRLVVVDAEGKLAGMITLTDIIKYLVGVRELTSHVTTLPTATEEPTEVED
jgi:CBS domain-containing protein